MSGRRDNRVWSGAYISHELNTISIFNQEFDLPTSQCRLERFSIKPNKLSLKPGQTIKLELIPSKKSSYKTRYKLH